MAEFLFQGLEAETDHFELIRSAFDLENIESGVLASAFVNAAGVSMILDKLIQLSERVAIYLGIRNGITSVQALQILKDNHIYPYCVDTATQSYIFHPKVLLLRNQTNARLLTGSANITTGGLIKNIEASIIIDLSLNIEHDSRLVDNVFNSFQVLRDRYPLNVYRLNDTVDLNQMVEQGLLIDENCDMRTNVARARVNQRTDVLPRMRLRSRVIPRTRRAVTEPTTAPENIIGTTAAVVAIGNTLLLWRSNLLTRRDLGIPTGETTNPTGSMLFKKGDASQNIDQRSYFRFNVFGREPWQPDIQPGKEHLERCHADFRIVIKGVDFGVFDLLLSHNSRTDTRSYEQNNSMTQIHWGTEVKRLIAREDLLNSVLCLYAPQEGQNYYTLVFDED